MNPVKTGSKNERAVVVGCDMVTLNYLKSHGFASLASDFQKSRCISTGVATSFRTLTLEKMAEFIRKKSSIATRDASGDSSGNTVDKKQSSFENRYI